MRIVRAARNCTSGLLFALICTATGHAQTNAGTLIGSVVDDRGASLAGVAITLTGGGAIAFQMTDAQGQFRLPDIAPGTYDVTAALPAFITVQYSNVQIQAGRETRLTMALRIKAEQGISTGEVPNVETQQAQSGTVISRDDLDTVPIARDPWAILQTLPGVLTDRVDVGGNESGSQRTTILQGSSPDSTIYSIDGVTITDPSALGQTPSYFDYDSFEDMQVIRGDGDGLIGPGGGVINFTTPLRGPTTWQGKGYYQSTMGNVPTDPLPDRLNHTLDNRYDYGASLGGPIVKDRLWLWGTHDYQRVDLVTRAADDVFDSPDSLRNSFVKSRLHWEEHQVTGSYLTSDKTLFGAPFLDRARSAAYDAGFSSMLLHIADNLRLKRRRYDGSISGSFAHLNPRLDFSPIGGLNVPARLTAQDNWVGSYLAKQKDTPQTEFKLDATNDFTIGGFSHSLRYGLNDRKAEDHETDQWPTGRGILENQSGTFFFNPGNNDVLNTIHSSQWHVQDTLRSGNLTGRFGVAYNRQTGENGPSSIGRNALEPQFVPGFSTPGLVTVKWTSWSPRVSLTYNPFKNGTVGLSYARYGDQLSTDVTNFTSRIKGDTSIPGAAVTANNQLLGFFTRSMLDTNFGDTGNEIDADFHSPTNAELLLAGEYHLQPKFWFGLNFAHRTVTDLPELRDIIDDGKTRRPAMASDYDLWGRYTGTLPNGDPIGFDAYSLRPQFRYGDGLYLTNSELSTRYTGLTLSLHEHASPRSMLNASWTRNNWSWHVPQIARDNDYPGIGLAGPQDGRPVEVLSRSIDTPSVVMNSHWSYDVNGQHTFGYMKSWAFDGALNLSGREGYPLEYYVPIDPPDGRTRLLDAAPNDALRYDAVHTLDVRIARTFHVSKAGLTVSADVFNALDAGTVLQRGTDMGNTQTRGAVLETLGDRVYRVGARLQF